MSAVTLIKTGFAAGELDPRLTGRSDLDALAKGAALLENVVVQVTGGVTRRPGMRRSTDVPGGMRLVPFDGADGGAVLAFGPFKVDVIIGDAIAATPSTPAAANWSNLQVPQLSFARLGESLLICHPDLEPRQLVRLTSGGWQLRKWSFAIPQGAPAPFAYREPFARFAADEVALQPVKTGLATDQPIPRDSLVTLSASAPVFTALHAGTRLRIKGRQVTIQSVRNTTQAIGLVLEALNDGQTTRDWDEQAFSQAHGYPITVGFWQDRLVVGGSRDLPDAIWMSRTGRYFDFDEGTGLDDEAFRFRLGTERNHAIRALVSGRQLQVFTSVGEWALSGDPLTPATIRADQQTGIGSPVTRSLPPVEVDGATLFVSRSGKELREFLFTDDQQAFQAADLAVLARHLLADPVDMAFDPIRRLVLVVRADGSMAAATIDRENGIVAWSRLTTNGLVRAVTYLDGRTWLLVSRNGTVSLEYLDDSLGVDGTLTFTATTPRSVWAGLERFNDRQVWLIGDGRPVGRTVVTNGSVTLPQPASTLVLGLAFTHAIEPVRALPLPNRVQDARYRVVRLSFRLLTTLALRLDLGSGPAAQALPAVPGGFTGDHAVRVLGWRRGIETTPWRIAQDDPSAFTLLSVSHQLQVID
ncbi:hypothetical protein [Geminicoccus flavidas]|uniref:hypothetical protein n=1 Tax=Geminicoccus flavidas TaxID=2506407 RepID=UPI001357291E|nr:hypothetical protein [Geminicoccus flavidas]